MYLLGSQGLADIGRGTCPRRPKGGTEKLGTAPVPGIGGWIKGKTLRRGVVVRSAEAGRGFWEGNVFNEEKGDWKLAEKSVGMCDWTQGNEASG
ncbi:MAG: hypothetical protein LBF75_09045 [Treponema sp.]|jgi:hypothetical protein|nr:hypothetical protein [Treponema sp.]